MFKSPAGDTVYDLEADASDYEEYYSDEPDDFWHLDMRTKKNSSNKKFLY